MRMIARILAAPFFIAAAAFYLYVHAASDNCEAFALLPLFNSACTNDVVTWLLTVLIAAPGAALWAFARSKAK